MPPPAASSGRQQQQSLRAGPLLFVALVAVNLSTAPLLVTAKSLPRSRWVAASSNGGSLHDSSASSNARAVAVGVRCGATSSGKEDEGEDTDEPPRSPLSEGGLAATVKETISKLTGVVRSLLGGKGSKSGGAAGGGTKAKKSSKRKPNSSSGGFTEAFEAKYGKRHPKFNEKSFGDATETAWGRNRLCLVYIAAEKGSGGKAAKVDDAICKALADPEVAEFIDSSFVMWVPGGKSSAQRVAASAAAAKRVGARSLPFLGVVNSASETDKMTLERKLERSTVAMHHCNPPPSASQMVSWMARVLELKKNLLEVELAEQQRLKDEDTIYTERVEGYSKSLKDDALREVREREEEAERARLAEEERLAQEVLEAKQREDVERREKKAAELGQEPPESAVKGAEAKAATLMLRLADGSRIRRRFLRSDPMGKVLDWADVQGVDLDAQRLSSTMPKASFSHPGDSGMTIEEAGLGRQALLFVEQKPKGATGDSDGTVDEAEAAAAAGDEGTEREL
ncbi:unnamed protein product [Ectocarpus sp. CCAP 1310/34]|nr:unnamed protein product [Ectocarpus sp. CCAP 1310/34]